MGAEDQGARRCAGEGNPGVAGGVEVVLDVGDGEELRLEPIAGALPGGSEGDALGTVLVAGEGGEFAEVGDDLRGIGWHFVLALS